MVVMGDWEGTARLVPDSITSVKCKPIITSCIHACIRPNQATDGDMRGGNNGKENQDNDRDGKYYFNFLNGVEYKYFGTFFLRVGTGW